MPGSTAGMHNIDHKPRATAKRSGHFIGNQRAATDLFSCAVSPATLLYLNDEWTSPLSEMVEQLSSKELVMAIARVTEIIASSNKSFEDAIEKGINRASKTLKNVEGAWIKEQKVVVKNGKISEYRVDLKVTFILTN
jgi:dodecin